MRDFINKYEIWIFLILAPIINTFLVYATKIGLVPDFIYSHVRFYLLLLFLILIVKFTRGKEGVKEVFRPMSKWKFHPKWYLFSFLFALTIATITLLLKSFYYKVGLFTFFHLNFIPIWSVLGVLIVAFVGEVTWVSYSVRQLSKTIKPFYASQIVGVIWALWWVPAVYLNIEVISETPVWALTLTMMGAAGMCTIVYYKTKSGICVWLLQFMLNMTGIMMPVSPSSGGTRTYQAFAIIYFLTMLGFMYFMNPSKKTNIIAEN